MLKHSRKFQVCRMRFVLLSFSFYHTRKRWSTQCQQFKVASLVYRTKPDRRLCGRKKTKSRKRNPNISQVMREVSSYTWWQVDNSARVCEKMRYKPIYGMKEWRRDRWPECRWRWKWWSDKCKLVYCRLISRQKLLMASHNTVSAVVSAVLFVLL